jgi:preprotein translocase subunit SecF
MIEIIKRDLKIDFVSKFTVTAIISTVLVLAGLYFTITQMSYGVDFRGGAEIQMKFNTTIEIPAIRNSLERGGLKGALVQSLGEKVDNEFLVKVSGNEANLNKLSEDIQKAMTKDFSGSGLEIRKVDIVGPKAGAALRTSGFQAMLWALIAIMVYIGLRFDFKYSPGAIAALLHDVIIILGIFALSGTEFTLQTVAALLAIIGYSVNDTVIVYDRVREHEEGAPTGKIGDHINIAINETLSRTILTSGTTLFIALSMYFFGGGAIKDFFMAITLGVFVGTYSSIFVAAPVTLFLDRFKADA